ncbi:type IV pilus modification protein PilV [Marichromatium gracile]|uniref:type IV pilus modification protein PilV n=1 Tax=Marichromatium gracile TaxID=1048 RepID=UPI001F42FF93|nr:type IV pilus modification protein PilV [Marichromatium gracile]MCF1182616.1 type IV pilus modification protein PilV [Marichromatium gracile]
MQLSPPQNAQRGFSLLESLIAMVVLAIGLLGMAELQTTAMRLNSSAYLRTQATNLAYDIIDRMRANRQQALAGAYDGQDLATDPQCPAASAASGTLAARDVQHWRAALACTLPRGTGSIVRNDDSFTVTVQWDDSRGEDPAQQFVMTSSL